ncbi:uncharacterized protein LOC114314276 [Camellia sinensis]|uniref:uncharacterized protein LOC114314276 n=1 Tax=Camellia sinensis TaxID=4442 RepID=UPI001035BDF8|nr:uncharacterized protein LOC114314276 [Camellia sinensis]
MGLLLFFSILLCPLQVRLSDLTRRPWCLQHRLVVPTASIFGSSWTNWQQIFAHTKTMIDGLWSMRSMEKTFGICSSNLSIVLRATSRLSAHMASEQSLVLFN